MEWQTARLDHDDDVVVVHDAVQGRVRVRIPALKRSPPLSRRLEAAVSAGDGIARATANATTGSLLILFDPALPSAHIVERVAACLTETHSPSNDALPAAADAACWHAVEAGAVLARLGSGRAGLTETDARASLSRHGANRIPLSAPRSRLAIATDQLKSLPVAMLLGSAALSVLTGGVADAAIILGVVAINAAIGFVTERQAERTIASLSGAPRPPARVLRRDGARLVRSEDVVVGDILDLTPGSFVAADGRVIEAHHLSVNESMLTGESLPAAKAPGVVPRATPLADRSNMVYQGTAVTGGGGHAVVVATGRHTEMARIHHLVGETRQPPTPMQRQLDRLGNRLVFASAALCVGMLGIGLLRGYGLVAMIKSAVSLAVAALPEGLPTVATTTLALGARDMRRHKVLVRRIGAVETLGSVDLMCFDKTGTLTLNRMSAVAAQVGGRRLKVGPRGITADGEAVDPGTDGSLHQLLIVAALCNEAGQPDGVGGNGSATETALLAMARDGGLDTDGLRLAHPRNRLERRTESRKFMVSVHDYPGGRHFHAVKGSPAEVLALCGTVLVGNEERPLDDEQRRRALVENDRMAGRGLRVIGFAGGAAAPGTERAPLAWLGLVGLADPVRPGMADLMARFHAAGIDTAMVTGDQSATAFAIAEELALSRHGQVEILDAGNVETADPRVIGPLAARTQVFARVSPGQKLRIVQALQTSGRVVAMTGDGINDSPALKAADIGVAMGHCGTDVAREAADIVIEDDDLRAMTVAVANGRTIYANVRKAIRYLLTTNMSEIEIMLGATALGLGQPLTPMQLLWINLVTDIFPGLALAMEPADDDVLKQPPRDPSEPVVPGSELRRMGGESLLLAAGSLAAYGWGMARYGTGARANSLAFLSLTTSQLLYALSCRDPGHDMVHRRRRPPNRWLRLALIGSFAAQALLWLVPGLRRVFGLAPLGIADLAVSAAGGLLPLLAVEAGKAVAPPARPTAKETPETEDGDGP